MGTKKPAGFFYLAWLIIGIAAALPAQAAPPLDNAQSYFVAPGGNDSSAGTMAAPFATIGKGVASAAADPARKNVLVSAGTYSETITLPNGVSLYGSFSIVSNWLRASEFTTTISSPNIAVQAINYTSPGVLEGFNITSTGATAGQSSIALYLNNAPGLVVRFNTLRSGLGSNGTAGANSLATGANGTNGSPGINGTSNGSAGGQGGPGATSTCSAAGGNGGIGGFNTGKGQDGFPSQTGSIGGPGASSSGCFGGGNAGGPGASGVAGGNGNPGSGGSGGSILAGLWATSAGGVGGTGLPGGSGGGGGGGGGGEANCCCTADRGGGGGGGGSGGCGGGGGGGGTGGGGSFGILALDSGSAVFTNNTIQADNGGTGGAGGNGAGGGLGSSGGPPGSGPDDAGPGGMGGNGAQGGPGGGGGGGAGGPSIAIFSAGTSNVSVAQNAVSAGAGGAAGPGGTPNGITGVTGQSSTTSGALTARAVYALSVAKAGAGLGTVRSALGGIDCGSTCAGSYGAGTEIVLSASSVAGYVFAGWSGACSGTGACVVTMDAAKSVTATFSPGDPPRLGNISTRGQVLTESDVMIAGFIIEGLSSKTVVINVAGPSLANFGVANPLANPTLTLVRSSDNAVIEFNDNWQSAANAVAIQASGFAPNNTLEPAILMNLAPGAYTAIVQGAGGGTGVGLVGVFEVDHHEVPLINISTRGRVLTGNDVMIAGFIIQGGPQEVVINVAGPSLANYGVANPLANPTLTLVRSSDNSVIEFNDNWQSASNASQIQSSGFAPNNTLEPAILVTLQPGAYTAIVQGAGGGTGVALVGVFATH